MIGTRVLRNEDPELLTKGGTYVDDLGPKDAYHVTFVRSTAASARIIELDLTHAEAMPGVIAVFDAAKLELKAAPPFFRPLNQDMLRTDLAVDVVRYVGEPVAAVVSSTREQGVDAAEMVLVDYDLLDPVIASTDAVTDTTLVNVDAGTNIVFEIKTENDPQFFDDCDVTVSQEFLIPRMSVAAIEPRATISHWESDSAGRDQLTQWCCTQGAHGTRDDLAKLFDLDPDQVRVVTPDVGGSFGGKGGFYPEDRLVARIAKQLKHPVRWNETRTESMLGLGHGRDVHVSATIGGSNDGNVTHWRAHFLKNAGAYGDIGALLPNFTRMMATGVYDIENVECSAQSVITNTVSTRAFRGAGRPEATHALERLVDLFAAAIDMDPLDVRRRNVLTPSAFPHMTPTGASMDSGDYAGALDLVAEACNIEALRAEQLRRREDPSARLLGLGWCSYVEITNPIGGGEFASIEVQPDGSAIVLTGSSTQGQGHHTTFAQLASGATGIPFEMIEVRHGDTAVVPRGGGTGGSKSLQLGGSAVIGASEQLVDDARQVAATMLEANPADIVLDASTGRFAVAGTPAVSLGWADLAANAAESGAVGLLAEHDFKPPASTFPFGAHLAVVEVDRDTGEVALTRHIACDDAGVIVNPMIVDGQVHGGLAAGIGLALMESFQYDEDGNPLTANFMDYALPSAAEYPSFERLEMQTPTDRNPLGAKGIGESGTIGSTPAVHNAVVDALSHLGIQHLELPLTPQRVWQAIASATHQG